MSAYAAEQGAHNESSEHVISGVRAWRMFSCLALNPGGFHLLERLRGITLHGCTRHLGTLPPPTPARLRRTQSGAWLLRGMVGHTVAEDVNPGARETLVEIPALPFLVLGDLGQVTSSTSASASPSNK